MKKQLLGYSVLGILLFAGNAMAECPNGLSADQMYDCIVVEGAGDIHDKSVFPEVAKSQEKSGVTQQKQSRASEAERGTKLAELK